MPFIPPEEIVGQWTPEQRDEFRELYERLPHYEQERIKWNMTVAAMIRRQRLSPTANIDDLMEF